MDKSEAKTVPFEKSLYMALITGIELYNVILVIFCFENYLLIIAVFFHHWSEDIQQVGKLEDLVYCDCTGDIAP